MDVCESAEPTDMRWDAVKLPTRASSSRVALDLQSAKQNSNEVKSYPVAARAPTTFRNNTIPAIPLRPLSLALIQPQLTSSPTTTSSVFSPEDLVFAIADLKFATSPYFKIIR